MWFFEGRDGAGKGGTIRAITGRVSPAFSASSRLPAPSDREKTADVHAAYMAHFPAAGEDRHLRPQLVQRAAVELRHGLLLEGAAPPVPRHLPGVEKFIVEGGDQLIKYWLEVSDKEQKRRFEARIRTRCASGSSAPWTCLAQQVVRKKRYSRARDIDASRRPIRNGPIGASFPRR
jgi:polyphosphate kinase 2 (PPK2 family)